MHFWVQLLRPTWLTETQTDSALWVLDETNVDLPRIARKLTNRTVGLALSSGGARGLSHLGVIKVLEAANIPIDMTIVLEQAVFLPGLPR